MPEVGEGDVMVKTTEEGRGSGLQPEEFQEVAQERFSVGSKEKPYTTMTVAENSALSTPPTPTTATTPTVLPGPTIPAAQFTAADSTAVPLTSASQLSSSSTSPNANPALTASEKLPDWVQRQYPPGTEIWPPTSWLQRALGKPWEDLVKEPPSVGPLICRRRGKLVAFAAGRHAVAISLGLEGHLFGMKPSTFWKIITKDRPGNNDDPEKAKLMRTYDIPAELIVPDSSPRRPRTVRILMALITREWVTVLSDFSGLVRMHVKSKESVWTEEDLAVGSKEWLYLFESFKGGPDWKLERELALDALDTWRFTILKERKRYIDVVHSQGLITSYFNVGHKRKRDSSDQHPGVSLTQRHLRPLIHEICKNSHGAFSGFGRHLANDFLFSQVLHPATPSYVVCSDDELFKTFKEGIEAFLAIFTSKEFYDNVRVAFHVINSFGFDKASNDKYFRLYLYIFRRSAAILGADLYRKYARLGYFDRHHTIGETYPAAKAAIAEEKLFYNGPLHRSLPNGNARLNNPKSFKWRRVYFVGGDIRAYTVIRARVPAAWGDIPKRTPVAKDIAAFGYVTTIGVAQFHEQLLNRASPRVRPGARAKYYRVNENGKRLPGRPSKQQSRRVDMKMGDRRSIIVKDDDASDDYGVAGSSDEDLLKDDDNYRAAFHPDSDVETDTELPQPQPSGSTEERPTKRQKTTNGSGGKPSTTTAKKGTKGKKKPTHKQRQTTLGNNSWTRPAAEHAVRAALVADHAGDCGANGDATLDILEDDISYMASDEDEAEDEDTRNECSNPVAVTEGAAAVAEEAVAVVAAVVAEGGCNPDSSTTVSNSPSKASARSPWHKRRHCGDYLLPMDLPIVEKILREARQLVQNPYRSQDGAILRPSMVPPTPDHPHLNPYSRFNQHLRKSRARPKIKEPPAGILTYNIAFMLLRQSSHKVPHYDDYLALIENYEDYGSVLPWEIEKAKQSNRSLAL